MTPDYIQFQLPLAQGLQYHSIYLANKGVRFLGAPLPHSETFAGIAGKN